MGGVGSGRKDEGKSRANRAANGQIKISKPKTIGEAIQMLSSMNSFLKDAINNYNKDKSVTNSLILNHTKKQMARAINLAKAFRK